ncbi:RanGTP-binding protein-domain-containing protein [Umbelopsis sp. PMI_123]|nr:RanGTP-binding protein-domain-containing protein [Umbelopsis sp. PMI_123]
MDELFAKLALQTANTVTRIAINHATNAALRSVTSYLLSQPKTTQQQHGIEDLQRQLDLRIKNLKPTIDIIARRVADGQEDLEPALEMCKDLRRDIDSFSADIDLESKTSTTTPEFVAQQLRKVLQRVDDTIPWLQLALRTSDIEKGTRRGANASSSRLLRAASILQQCKDDGGKTIEFNMRLYSMFLGNVRPSTAKDFTWKEDYHKCKVTLTRKLAFKYDVLIEEDLNDLRYHEEGEKAGELKFDINTLQRMYYTKSGELLNIEDSKTPVLVLKITKDATVGAAEQPTDDKTSTSTLKTISSDEAHTATWFALEEWKEEEDDSDDEEAENNRKEIEQGSQARKVPFHPTLAILEAAIRLAQLEITEEMDILQAGDDLIDSYMT